jgi:hypothetical protein
MNNILDPFPLMPRWIMSNSRCQMCLLISIYLESVAGPDQAARCGLTPTAADMRDVCSRHMHEHSQV